MRKNGAEEKRMEVALLVHLLIEFSLMDHVNVFYIKKIHILILHKFRVEK